MIDCNSRVSTLYDVAIENLPADGTSIMTDFKSVVKNASSSSMF
jgi:hypothetical protein